MMGADTQPEDYATTQRLFHTAEQQLAMLASLTAPIPAIATPIHDLSVFVRAFAREQRTGTVSRWIIVFMNNHELRPGGGFIGSVGFVHMRNFRLERFEIVDVYELDGQVSNHTQPHYAVATYLHKPTEFIRDSNFEPFFSTNAEVLLGHLQTLPNRRGSYAGVIGVTVSGFEEILRLVGPIELPTYHVVITPQNISHWLDTTIQNNFFPGSTYKRDVLSSLSNHTLRALSEQDPIHLMWTGATLLKKRAIVGYSTDPTLQAVFEAYSLSGPSIKKYQNWLLPVDANVGVNKLSPHIQKTQVVARDLQHNSYRYDATYHNTSSQRYLNFAQIYLPPSAYRVKIQVNGVSVDPEYQMVRNTYQVIGVLITIPPSQDGKISIEYLFPTSRLHPLALLYQTGASPIPTTVLTTSAKQYVEQYVQTEDRVLTQW